MYRVRFRRWLGLCRLAAASSAIAAMATPSGPQCYDTAGRRASRIAPAALMAAKHDHADAGIPPKG
jgi:hypothetical protein